MKNGFTLIELLISTAVIVVLVILFYGGFTSFRESSQLSEAHSVIVGMLRDARSRTLSSEKNTEYGVHFETNHTMLFLGNVYDSGSSSNEIYNFPSLARISSINLGGSTDIVFARLAGSASASGTITLESVSNPSKTKTITILSSGSIE